MFNKVSKAIVITLACVMLLATFAGCGKKTKTITGNEWLIKQQECFDDLEAFASGMDEVYALYFTQSITAEDFLVELNLLKQQYKLLNAYYEEMKKENPIEPETHSFLSKKGTEAIENLYKCLGEILDTSVDSAGVPLPADQLTYQYLAYQQTLNGYIAEYTTAIAWYNDALSTGMPEIKTKSPTDTPESAIDNAEDNTRQ